MKAQTFERGRGSDGDKVRERRPMDRRVNCWRVRSSSSRLTSEELTRGLPRVDDAFEKAEAVGSEVAGSEVVRPEVFRSKVN